MSAGRPTAYKPEYCEALIEHCKQGLSRESFAAEVDVEIRTLYDWINKHPEFLHSWQKAQKYRLKKLEKLVMTHAEGKTRGSTAAALFMLKNIAPDLYKDRVEVTNKEASKMTEEELRAELKELLEDKPSADS